jgi:uncharacterized protein YbcC (UPF0753/DUF2309 family)
MIHEHFQKNIDKAAKLVGKTWPLYAFVTSNPLSGYEDMPFEKAVRQVEKLLGSKAFPGASFFRQAWEQKEIDEHELVALLKEKGISESPEWCLRQMESQKTVIEKNVNHDLDRIMAKWLAAFMDEGLAEWEMPNKKLGFYKAWRKLAIYDGEIGIIAQSDVPKSGADALAEVLKGYPKKEHMSIFTYHLAALPGWTGYIKYRQEANSPWQTECPITLEDYLAVRLFIAKHINAQMLPKTHKTAITPISNMQHIWLNAWEKSWQNRLVDSLTKKSMSMVASQNIGTAPDAQLVFCIDTRSEAIRRHIESKGNYETYGYAGFFGIAMDYQNLSDGLIRKSCPPIVSSAYKVVEIPQKTKLEKLAKYNRKNELIKFRAYFLKRMKNMLPSAFGYVEGSGAFYGMSLLARTLLPSYLDRLNQKNTLSHEDICEPKIATANSTADSIDGIPLNEKTALVKSAFDLTGWKDFSPLVFFVGHGSHSTNNPFGSSLDCGACAASPGRHNARMLAKLANLPEVRRALKENFELTIPTDTFFIGAEHNTTTDEIVFFDSEVPDSHHERLQKVKSDLYKARQTVTQERMGIAKDSVATARKKALDWAETRPEWGLAKNAGFIIAPRTLTKNRNLDGQCFLHSYNWESDKNGSALEGILQGPMVVTQWINNHYYFSTIDTEKFGGGSKITHNVTGKFGVVQGNGGDLKMGLPLQSVKESDEKMYHRPLRLSVFIQAPVARVEEILQRNKNLKNLLDNEWIYLLVMDPSEKNRIHRYQKNMQWLRSVGSIASSKNQEDKVLAEKENELSMV